LRAILVVGGGVMLLSIIAALWMARATVRPIQALAKASLHVATGDLDAVDPLPRSRMRELDEAGLAFTHMVEGLKERARIMDLFGRVVPTAVAERMPRSPKELAPQKVEATVLFCDLVGFTTLCEGLETDHLVQVLNAYFTDMVDIIQGQGGIVTQFQGDAILAVFNVPLGDRDHPAKALAAARAMHLHLENSTFLTQTLAIAIWCMGLRTMSAPGRDRSCISIIMPSAMRLPVGMVVPGITTIRIIRPWNWAMMMDYTR